MKKIQLAVFILGIALMVASITYAVYVYYNIVDYEEFNTDIIVTDHMGFNLDKDAVHFGLAMPDTGSQRFFNLSTKKDVIVRMKATGNISKFIYFPFNDFRLNASEGYKPMTVYANVPKDTPYGNYSGKIKVYFLRP